MINISYSSIEPTLDKVKKEDDFSTKAKKFKDAQIRSIGAEIVSGAPAVGAGAAIGVVGAAIGVVGAAVRAVAAAVIGA